MLRLPRLIANNRLAMAGAIVLGLIVAACVLSAPWSFGSSAGDAGPRYDLQDRDARLLPPTWAPHAPDERERAAAAPATRLFGTDLLGRDLFTRVLAGGAVSLLVGSAAALISVLIGTTYGLIAGYAGGRTDAVMMRIVDVLYGLPYVLLVVLLAVAGDAIMERYVAAGHAIGESARTWIDLGILLVAIGGVSWLTMARVVRGQVLSLKAQPFMEAARAVGTPVHRQLARHLLPNLVGVVLVYATLTVPQAILQESFLSFLGIGVKPPLPSWGTLASEGLAALNPVRTRWWLLVFPCAALSATLLALSFLGEGLREVLDPRRLPR
jgi:ABC-type dipeptide/oligopeptide/nickel transport system permease subunit